MEVINDFSWKIAGAAGHGILSAGMMLAKTAVRGGLYAYATAEYPSLIRGGHNNLDVRIASRPLDAHTKHVNILVALNQESIDKHLKKITPDGALIYDSDTMKVSVSRKDIRVCPIPLTGLAKQAAEARLPGNSGTSSQAGEARLLAERGQSSQAGSAIMRNVVAMGATFGLADFDLKYFNTVLEDTFKKKSEKISADNISAAKAGFDYIRSNFGNNFKYKLKPGNAKGNIFISGHEAVALGAIKAGCKFYAAYPMTPASSLLSTMAKFEREYGLVVKHTEDEIAAINMAVGANFAGVRAMTGTSGGGFALMAEGFGLAAQTETPLVVIESQRPGPATGMATHTGQGDLRFMLHASTDEFPRIVVAPGDPQECFRLTFDAFNLAEKYQLPVIVLTDKYLGESFHTTKPFDHKNLKVDRGKLIAGSAPTGYLRYKITQDSVSPRSIPGVKGGEHTASSYEHDELGSEREEEEIRVAMHKKRFQKLVAAAKEIPEPVLIGPANADITLVSWGSTKGPILEAMRLLEAGGISANYLHVTYISPLPVATITKVMESAKKTVCIENNMTGIFAGVVKEQNGMDMDHKMLKFDGRPFAPEDIAAGIKFILNPEGRGLDGSMIRLEGKA